MENKKIGKLRMTDDTKTVFIPACSEHEGFYGMYVKLKWVCPRCGQPRGQIKNVRSYDGSRVLFCDGWENPCGHVDKYDDCRKEAAENGWNNPCGHVDKYDDCRKEAAEKGATQ